MIILRGNLNGKKLEIRERYDNELIYMIYEAYVYFS